MVGQRPRLERAPVEHSARDDREREQDEHHELALGVVGDERRLRDKLGGTG
jgi:hypothetical protein